MSARIAWMAASLAGMLIIAAHATLPSQVIALRAADLLGHAPTLAAAERGGTALLHRLLLGELLAAIPWLSLGALLALLLRLILQRWQTGERLPQGQSIVDHAGVALRLDGAAFDHVPAHFMLALAPMPATRLPRGASELERQAFAALSAADTPLAGALHSGLTLLQRAQGRYDAAVRQHGAGSLVAIAAAVCDLGALIAGEHRSGQRVDLHPPADHLALLALARLPACWRLAPAERARICALVDYLGTQQTPLHVEPELQHALNALRRLRETSVHAIPGPAHAADGAPVRPRHPHGARIGPIGRVALVIAGVWLPAVVLMVSTSPVRAQDAPMNPPKLEVLPPQRAGDVVVDGGVLPVWRAPPPDAAALPRMGRQSSDPAIVARIPPPAPRRRPTGANLEGAADRPEWRATVPGGWGVALAAAVVRIAPPGLPPPEFGSIAAALLQVPVSWSAGLDRATALEGILRANGLRAVVGDSGISVSQVPISAAAIVDDPAAWRLRADELEAAAREARRAEVATLAREREELETRRRAAEVELKQLQEAADRLQREHGSRLSATNAAFTDREWRLSPEDSTLRQGLARWARLEGVGFAWEADYDLPVVAELAYRGPLPTVIERLMHKVPPASKLIYSLDRMHGLVVRAAPRRTQRRRKNNPKRVDAKRSRRR